MSLFCGKAAGKHTWNRGMSHTGALLRGGNFNNGTNAGPLTVNGNNQPSDANNNIGFRCAR